MMRWRWLAAFRAPCIALLLAALGACGGGGSDGGGSTPANGTSAGSLSLGLAGGAPASYAHVWVTVSAVALNTDANCPWSASDATWLQLRLDAPKTIDLVAVTNGTIAPLLTGKNLSAASYAQMRLIVLHHDQPLADSAKALALAANDQVDVVDAGGVVQHQPLEIADAALAVRVGASLVVAAGVASDITLQWDIEHSLVRFAGNTGSERFSVRADLRAYDLAKTGAIVGIVDKSLFCASGAQNGCIDEVVASAHLPSDDGRIKQSVRSTPVVVGDTYAVFALYPLPPLASGQTFDVVIRGRNMRTMVVRGVPASAADLLAATPTQLGANPPDPAHPLPLAPVLSAQGDGHATLAQPLAAGAAQLVFGQTLQGFAELPLELVVANTDPNSGSLTRAVVLPSGPLRVADYLATAPLVFTDMTPQEGADAFSVMSRGAFGDAVGATRVIVVPGGASVSFVAPEPP